MSINQTLILEIKTKHEQAERLIGRLEGMVNSGSFPQGLNIPSINELRYALGFLLRYLVGEEKYANEALWSVKKSIYDCYETEGLFRFQEFKSFEEANRDIEMKDVFREYVSRARDFRLLQEFLDNTPEETRQDYCEELERLTTNVRPFALEVVGINQEIAKIRAQSAKRKADEEKQEALNAANLALATKTVKIRTRALIATISIGIGGAVGGYYLRGEKAAPPTTLPSSSTQPK